MEECGPCPVFASFNPAFALQLRKKHGKTSVRVVGEFCAFVGLDNKLYKVHSTYIKMCSYNLTCFGVTAIFRENINIDMKLLTISILKLSLNRDVKLKNVGSEVDILQTTYLVDCIIEFIFTIFCLNQATQLMKLMIKVR